MNIEKLPAVKRCREQAFHLRSRPEAPLGAEWVRYSPFHVAEGPRLALPEVVGVDVDGRAAEPLHAFGSHRRHPFL
jgi:hypothetical protein